MHDGQPAKQHAQWTVGEYHADAQGEAGKERHRTGEVVLAVTVTVVIAIPIGRRQRRWGERHDTEGEV
jgi:hypothetical protein